MKNYLLLSLLIVIVIILGTGCTADQSDQPSQPQLNIVSYPTQLGAKDQFTVTSEYLTTEPGAGRVKVSLTIKDVVTDRGLMTVETEVDNHSQTISFSNLDLDELDSSWQQSGLYFELNLIVNGKFQQQVSTKSEPTLIANWHRQIITTYFRPAYDQDGNERLTAFGQQLSTENPYYYALPYRPYYEGQVYNDNPSLYGEVKNKWIKVHYPQADPTSDPDEHKYVYLQWEDVGPWNVYDPYYVFGTNQDRPYAETGIDMGWTGTVRETNRAGLDISPAAMSYLTGGTIENPDAGKIKVSWRFVAADEVPQDGPWYQDVSQKLIIPQKSNYRTNTLDTID